jgi:chorismate mutase
MFKNNRKRLEKHMKTNKLEELRRNIDEIDRDIILLLSKRFKITEEIGVFKASNNLISQDKDREETQFKKISDLSKENGLKADYALKIYRCILDIVILRHQELKQLKR